MSMDVGDPTAVRGIFHSWTLPWFKPEWAHRAGLCPEPHLEVAEHLTGFPCRDPLAEGFSRCSSVLGGTESPKSPGLAVSTYLGISGQAREALAALCVGGRSHHSRRAAPAVGGYSLTALCVLGGLE